MREVHPKPRLLPSARGQHSAPGALGGVLTAALLACGLAAPPAAAEGFSLTVSPLVVELQGSPSGTLPFEIVVASSGTGRPAEFQVAVKPVRQDVLGNYKVAEQETGEHSAVPWIQVQPERFTLEPGKSQAVRGTLTFPRSFRGGAYAAVVIQLQPESSPDPGNVRQIIRNEFAVVVEAVAVAGGVRPDIRITRLAVVPASQKGMEAYERAYGPQALLVVAEVTNEGNVHGFARGTLSIWDGAGRKINQVPLGAGRGAVLPSATVQMGTVLTRGLPPGDYTLQAVINYGGLRPAITRQKVTIGEGVLQKGQSGRGARILVEPEAITLESVPGAPRFAAVRVQNLDKVPVEVSTQVLPLVYDEAGNPNVEPTDQGDPGASWVVLRPDRATLQPGTVRNFQVGVRPPREAEPRGYYAQVLVRALPAGEGEPNALETEVSVPIYVLLGSERAIRGRLAPLSIERSADGRFLVVGTQFANVGDVHVTPSAEVVMERKTVPEASGGVEYVGEPVWIEQARLSVPPTSTPVLPGGVRNLGAILEKPALAGEYRIRVFVRYGGADTLVQEGQITITPDETKAAPAPKDEG